MYIYKLFLSYFLMRNAFYYMSKVEKIVILPHKSFLEKKRRPASRYRKQFPERWTAVTLPRLFSLEIVSSCANIIPIKQFSQSYMLIR